ncbi:(d)CMP kinase [bacterium]|nr:(d)CMP kinase [candidate division CSSED10-310 bacterium]
MGLKTLEIVTIDGPAGSGKSTVARSVAEQMGYTFLDTGAMYRAVALGAIERNITATDLEKLTVFLNQIQLIVRSGQDMMRLYLDDIDVTETIRRPEMGQHASDFSRLEIVRNYCTRLQRRFGAEGRIVCEGRDMGTVVFPEARWKYFLTAALDERAMRRWKELQIKGEVIDYDDIRNSLKKRDFQDTNRDIAPLKPADDAVILDTTKMSIETVVSRIINDIRSNVSQNV